MSNSAMLEACYKEVTSPAYGLRIERVLQQRRAVMRNTIPALEKLVKDEISHANTILNLDVASRVSAVIGVGAAISAATLGLGKIVEGIVVARYAKTAHSLSHLATSAAQLGAIVSTAVVSVAQFGASKHDTKDLQNTLESMAKGTAFSPLPTDRVTQSGGIIAVVDLAIAALKETYVAVTRKATHLAQIKAGRANTAKMLGWGSRVACNDIELRKVLKRLAYYKTELVVRKKEKQGLWNTWYQLGTARGNIVREYELSTSTSRARPYIDRQ